MNTLRLFFILFCCTWASGVYSTSIIDSLHREALNLYRNQEYETAFKIFDKNLTLQKSDTTKETEFWTRTYLNAGACLLKSHRLEKAEKYLNKAIDEYLLIVKRQTSSKNYNRLAACFENRAQVMVHKGEFEKAVYDAKEATIWYNKTNKKVAEIRTIYLLSNIYLDAKKIDLAKQKCFEALKKSQSVKEISDKLLADIYHTLAMNYEYGEQDYKKSAKYYLKSIELTEDPVYLAKTLNNLAFVYLKDKNFPKAKDYLNQTIQLKKQIQNKILPKIHHQPHQ